LYFEVRHKGEPADPLDWLAALSRSWSVFSEECGPCGNDLAAV